MNRNKRAVIITTIVCGTLSAIALTISAIIKHKRKIRCKLPEPLAQRVLASKHLQQIEEEDENE